MAAHPEQGWSLLCNGVIVFDDTGELLPGGSIILPHIDRVFPLDAADAHRYRHERPNTGKVLLQP